MTSEEKAVGPLLDWDGLKAKGITYSHTHVRRLWEAGKFPAPIKLGPARLAWPESTIDAWIAKKVRPRILRTTDGGEVLFDEIVSMNGGGHVEHVVATLKDGRKVELVAKNLNEVMAA